MHIARKAIELGDDHRALGFARCGDRGVELGAAIERIRSLAGLNLDVFGGDRVAFGGSEPLDGCALRVEPEPRATLALRAYAIVGNHWLAHDLNSSRGGWLDCHPFVTLALVGLFPSVVSRLA